MTAALLLVLGATLVAYRLQLLTGGGAVAATLVGSAAVAAGLPFVVLLVFFFASANALSHWRAAERDRRIGAIVEKGVRRDAFQVVANGGAFAVAAVGAALAARGLGGRLFDDPATWRALAAGALATATADTWSTEVGTLLGRAPRLILTGRRVPPGTSGAVTVSGTTAAVCGALLAAMAAEAMHWGTGVAAIAGGGVAGSLLDSILGATVQERRWCATCDMETEQQVHRCGTATRHQRGLRWMGNDLVNLAGTIAGAAVTCAFA